MTLTSSLQGKRIVHVSAWAEALWHFRLPLLKLQKTLFQDVVVYCSQREYCGEKGHVKKLKEEGFDVRTGPIGHRPGIRTIVDIFALYRFLRNERFDVLMAHQPMGGLVGILAGWLAGVPVLIYSTGGLKHVPGEKSLANRILKLGEDIVLTLSDAIFLVNREDERHLAKQGSLRDKLFNAGPRGGCGVDVTRYNSRDRIKNRADARKDLSIGEDIALIGYVGRCVWEKGFRELVEACNILSRDFIKCEFKIVVIGDGVDLAGIKTLIKEKGLVDRFIFTGYKYNIDWYMSSFDLFVLPSYREGLPISLLDAMSMGIPSVASDIRGCNELITHEETGILVPAHDEKSLARALAKCMQNPQAAGILGTKAERFIHEYYAEDVLIGRTMDKIGELIQQHGKSKGYK